ncbi:MAG: hypothetical protein AAFO97_05680 [Pseudomonadota bacterium]
MSIKTRAKTPTLLFSLVFWGTTTHAAPGDSMALARDFATCQGRYAAQVDYDRLMGREIDKSAAAAKMFEQMPDAVAPTDPDARKEIHTSQQGALGVHWNLLHSADFSADDRLARHARDRAAHHIRMCETLVLG